MLEMMKKNIVGRKRATAPSVSLRTTNAQNSLPLVPPFTTVRSYRTLSIYPRSLSHPISHPFTIPPLAPFCTPDSLSVLVRPPSVLRLPCTPFAECGERIAENSRDDSVFSGHPRAHSEATTEPVVAPVRYPVTHATENFIPRSLVRPFGRARTPEKAITRLPPSRTYANEDHGGVLSGTDASKTERESANFKTLRWWREISDVTAWMCLLKVYLLSPSTNPRERNE